MASERKVARP